MGWNFPIASYLFGDQMNAVGDWWNKYQYVVYAVVVLVVLLIIALIVRAFK